MFTFELLSGTASSVSTGQRNNHQYKSFRSFGKRILSLAVLCLISNNSPTNVFNTVQASVNSDKVSFQVFELDSPLVDINWCGTTNEVILVQSTKGIIYRSRDRGDSWKKLHSIMNQTGQSVIDDETTVSIFFIFLTYKFVYSGNRKSQENDAKSNWRKFNCVYR